MENQKEHALMTKTIIVIFMILILNLFSIDLVSGSGVARIESITNNQSVISANNIAGLSKKTMTAKAYKTTNKKVLIYTESHHAYFKNGQIYQSENLYYDLSGKKFAELVSDYSKNKSLPTYIFKDHRTKYQEGLRFSDGRYVIFYKEQGESEKTEILSNTENIFSGQGWHYYLKSNLKKLENQSLSMRLLFPSRLDDYEFRIRILSHTSETIKLRLEFSSWIVRMFAPHLDLEYEKNSGKLLSFYGPSNISDESGDTQNIYIEYD